MHDINKAVFSEKSASALAKRFGSSGGIQLDGTKKYRKVVIGTVRASNSDFLIEPFHTRVCGS